MKATAFAIALMMGGAAIAQSTTQPTTGTNTGTGTGGQMTDTTNSDMTNTDASAQTSTDMGMQSPTNTQTNTGTHSGHDMTGQNSGTMSGTNQSMSGQSMSGQSTTGQTMSGQSMSGQSMSGQTTMQTGSMQQQSGTGMASNMAMPGPVVQPGNQNPEEDARGIPVISAAAVVPPGWNGVPATGVGGPLVDPTTGEAVNDTNYPPCTAQRTDNCMQAYTRRR